MRTHATETALGQAPENRWRAEDAAGLDELGLLVYRSNLLGRDPTLVNAGGGNTSAKLTETDFRGREIGVLRVKASGFDLATMERTGFVGLRLDDILPLRSRAAMTDAEMAAYLAHTITAPEAPRPSIETLLHAFTRHRHIDHTHPDVGLAFCTTAGGEALARRVFGSTMVWVPYRRPGFALAKQVAELVNADERVRVAFLGHHGLVTWGETAHDCYRNTVAVLGRCAEAVQAAARGKRVFSPVVQPPLPPDRRRAVAAAVAPTLRGAGGAAQRVIVHFDDSPEVLQFLAREEARDLAARGTACPDHIIRTKSTALWVEWDARTGDLAALKTAIRTGTATYAERYRAYLQAHQSPGDPEDDPQPRIALVPGIGLFATGSDKRAARVAAATYRRAIAVMSGATALGEFVPLLERDAYDIEYWPLERYKLSLMPPPAALSGQVALVTGAASGIGRATAKRLARAGAHVVAADINAAGVLAVTEAINDAHGEGRALAVPTDVTDEVLVRRVFREAAVAFGGVDIVVSNAGLLSVQAIEDTTLAEWHRLHDVLSTGYFLVARAAFRMWQEQGTGGSLIFVASKNALAAGTEIAAYSAAKAAELHLARCLAEEGGPHGIRVNCVCPDAVIEGSELWSASRRRERARTYGIAPEGLEAYYRDRTALKVNITPDDVAEAILFFASSQSTKTTGAVLTVDGGIRAAYVR